MDRPKRKASIKASEKIEEYRNWKKSTSGEFSMITATPIQDKDKKYVEASNTQQKQLDVNGGYYRGPGYHYDRDYTLKIYDYKN